MTKQELAQLISAQSGVGVAATASVLSSLGGVLADTLASGESVFIRGFGTFKTVTRKEKKARNITAGTNIVIPAHNAPVVKFCDEFKGRMK